MLKCISLFSGGGGLDLGLEAAGFETVFASDIDHHSCESLKGNKETARKLGLPFLANAVISRADVTELPSAEILAKTGLAIGELDLLAGGPPCQAFSVFGKRKGRDDPRGQLVYHYLRMLRELQPKAFVFENVYGLLTVENGEVFRDLQVALSSPGIGLSYKLSVHRLNSVNYGVPQFRDRIFIIGSRDGTDVPEIESYFAKPSEAESQKLGWRTVEHGLRKLPPLGAPGAHNHTSRKHSQRIIERYSAMKFGERDSATRINKLDPRRPSYTIIVGSDAGGGKGHVHPHQPREVSPRESARMQCFPDWWEFSGTGRHPIRQVGNAVPSLLGFFVGRQIIRDIFRSKSRSVVSAIELLDQKHLFSSTELKHLDMLDQNNQQEDYRLAI